MTPSKIKPAQSILTNGVFFYPIRVYYEDTDAGGIVYYANYLKFAERARTESLRTLGIYQVEKLQESHTGFVVRSCHVEYLKSAVLDDMLVVSSKITEFSAASATIEQKIMRGDDVLATVETKLIYLNVATHRPERIPAEMAEKFKLLIAVQNH